MWSLVPSFYVGVESGDKVMEDGRVEAAVMLSAEKEGMLRAGRLCPKCHEPQSVAFPKVCELAAPDGTLLCGFPIRDGLASYMASEVSEDHTVGRKKSVSEKIAQMEQDADEDRFRREGSKGIWVPRSLS